MKATRKNIATIVSEKYSPSNLGERLCRCKRKTNHWIANRRVLSITKIKASVTLCNDPPLDFPQGITVVQDTGHRHCSQGTQGCNPDCHPGQPAHSVICSRLLQRWEITLDVMQPSCSLCCYQYTTIQL